MQGLIDGFYECGGLARARRAVYDGHVAGAEHLVHGCLLRGVEPRETHGIELAKARLHTAKQYLTQLCQSGAFGSEHIAKCLEHGAIAGLIEVELYAQPLLLLEVHHGTHARHGHHHARVIGIAHGAIKRKVVDITITALMEETDGLAKLEAMLYVCILGTGDFHYQLIQ